MSEVFIVSCVCMDDLPDEHECPEMIAAFKTRKDATDYLVGVLECKRDIEGNYYKENRITQYTIRYSIKRVVYYGEK